MRPPRDVMLYPLRRLQNLPAIGGSIPAAWHGLELTQPFHDKRVVEFGLAIPEDLHLKDGKERWLARTALADLYPPEFQTRMPGNDGPGPDFLMMAKRVEPLVLAEIDRMERAAESWLAISTSRRMRQNAHPASRPPAAPASTNTPPGEPCSRSCARATLSGSRAATPRAGANAGYCPSRALGASLRNGTVAACRHCGSPPG